MNTIGEIARYLCIEDVLYNIQRGIIICVLGTIRSMYGVTKNSINKPPIKTCLCYTFAFFPSGLRELRFLNSYMTQMTFIEHSCATC